MAQLVELEFFAADRTTHKIPAKTVFISPIHDFAVVSFDPRKLPSSVASKLKPADLAGEELSELATEGAYVMTVGNPFNSRDVRTFGSISGVFVLHWKGEYFQFDAPLNPGNSGGPLVHVGSGKVLGISSAGIHDADGIAFALPISVVSEEFRRWRIDPDYGHVKTLMAIFSTHNQDALLHGLQLESVTSGLGKLGNYLGRYPYWHVVAKAPANRGLVQGDIILAIDGLEIGDRGYRIREAVQRCQGTSVKVELIRNSSELLTVEVPVETIGGAIESRQRSLVTFSGFIFEEVNAFVSFAKVHGETRVMISDLVAGSFANDKGHDMRGGMVNAVMVGGTRYRVETLADLKAALAQVDPARSVVTLSVFGPIVMDTPNGFRYVTDPLFDIPRLENFAQDHVVPVGQVFSDENVNFDTLRSEFDFTGFRHPDSRSGMAGIGGGRAQVCATELANTRPPQ